MVHYYFLCVICPQFYLVVRNDDLGKSFYLYMGLPTCILHPNKIIYVVGVLNTSRVFGKAG